jgi:hypothetical protein
MNLPFIAASAATLVSIYLSLHTQAILSLLFFVIAFFTLVLSFILAPGLIKFVVLLAGLWFALYLCQDSECGSV